MVQQRHRQLKRSCSQRRNERSSIRVLVFKDPKVLLPCSWVLIFSPPTWVLMLAQPSGSPSGHRQCVKLGSMSEMYVQLNLRSGTPVSHSHGLCQIDVTACKASSSMASDEG